MPPELRGLVLSGGLSTRMGRDKGSLIYPPHAVDQRCRGYALLRLVCAQVLVSIRDDQRDAIDPDLPVVTDPEDGARGPDVGGPGVGILAAAARHPDCAWLVLACDFPWMTEEEIQHLARARDPACAATVCAPAPGAFEPLFAIWEPPAIAALREGFARGHYGPQAALRTGSVRRIQPLDPRALLNANTPADARALDGVMRSAQV